MKKVLLSLALLSNLVYLTNAQITTVLDFESAATSTVFQYFGSPLDGTLNEVVANPDPSGINTSANVARFVKPGVAETWAGGFSNPDPTTQFDFTTNGKVRIKVWMNHIGQVGVKFESSTNGGSNWLGLKTNTVVNGWEELEFDVTQPSAEAPTSPAAGYTYNRIVVFFGFGTAGSGTDLVSYFDDVVTVAGDINPIVTTPFYDFETDNTGNLFQYFGSPLDGTTTEIIANPNASGINTSANVGKYIKPAVAETWAGAFSLDNPTIVINLQEFNKISVKVHMDHIGNLALKLENSTNGGQNWITTVSNTVVNEWEELIFDASLPSVEAPGNTALGFTYTRAILFFDFGTAGTGVDVTSYFDDIKAVGDPIVEVTTPVYDFETENTTQDFYYFGSPLDGTNTEVVANPNPTGINTSGNVVKYVKPAVAEVWAGCFSLDNPTIDLVVTEENDQISIKVHMDHIGVVGLKLENSIDGGDNWLGLVSNTVTNQWEELLFNTNIGSNEAPFNPAVGHTYRRVVVFFDFGTAGTGTDVTSYFDDIRVSGPVGTHDAPATGTFTLLGNPPVQGFTTLRLGAPATEATLVTLTDAVGRTLSTYTLAAGNTDLVIPTATLPAGLYLVQVRGTNGQPATQKLFVR